MADAEKLKREGTLRLAAAETLEELDRIRPDFYWKVEDYALKLGELKFSGRTTGETTDGWVGYELSFGVTTTPSSDEFAVSCFLRADRVEEYGWGSGKVHGTDLAHLLDEAENKLWEEKGERIARRLREIQECIDVFHALVNEKTQ